MMIIGICNDDAQFTKELHTIVDEFMRNVSDWEFRTYQGGEEVIAAIEAHVFDCNLLFMDILMEHTSGIDTARYIHEHQVDTDLIFITGAMDHVLECVHYNTFAYLVKPLSKADVVSELNRYLSEIQLTPKCLNVPIRGTTHRVPLNNILYIDSDLRKVTIHTKYKEFDCYQKLGTLENILKKEGFIRCHQSYLVSANKITSYNVNALYIDDIKIPVSRKYQGAIRKFLNGDSEAAATAETDCYITTSLSCNQGETGAFVCIEGAYIGAIIRLRPEQKILVGRDGTASDMIVNLPLVSRTHCSITYHADRKEYEIVDFSNNGTFVNREFRLVKDEKYILKPGTEICFGDKSTIYKLG